MPEIVVLADDLTGALDTGVQLGAHGVAAVVVCGGSVPADTSAKAVILNLETRHQAPTDAYKATHHAACSARASGARCLYVKTDSGLRGNIGAALSAARDAWGGSLAFIPAHPRYGRVTRNGIHYISGVPVTQSVFGADLLNPVRHDSVADILAEQGAGPMTINQLQDDCICLLEPQTEMEMADVAAMLCRRGQTLYAGCAGFGAFLPMLCSPPTHLQRTDALHGPVLVATASTSGINQRQMRRGERHGFASVLFDDVLLPAPDLSALTHRLTCALKGGSVMLETARDHEGVEALTRRAEACGLSPDATGERIAKNMGQAVAHQVWAGFSGTLCLFGGDTLTSSMQALGVDRIEPLEELEMGVVISQLRLGGKTLDLVTKSGSFGRENVLESVLRRMQQPVCSACGGAVKEVIP